jgi:hypothetical protein
VWRGNFAITRQGKIKPKFMSGTVAFIDLSGLVPRPLWSLGSCGGFLASRAT